MKWWMKDFKPDVLESIFYDSFKNYSKNIIVPCPYKVRAPSLDVN